LNHGIIDISYKIDHNDSHSESGILIQAFEKKEILVPIAISSGYGGLDTQIRFLTSVAMMVQLWPLTCFNRLLMRYIYNYKYLNMIYIYIILYNTLFIGVIVPFATAAMTVYGPLFTTLSGTGSHGEVRLEI